MQRSQSHHPFQKKKEAKRKIEINIAYAYDTIMFSGHDMGNFINMKLILYTLNTYLGLIFAFMRTRFPVF
jgi:hypothetical protein